MKLLVAEDSLTQRIMLQVIGKEWGFDVIVAEDGQQAWEILSASEAPRLALLDWEMPGLDGPEVCRRVRAINTEDPPYILLITSRNETGDIVAGLEAGANDYISKPFENAELLARFKVGMRMLKLQSDLIGAKKTLEFQATHDVLTESMNRRAIMDVLNQEVARSKRNGQALSIRLVDVDHFKQINDNYGHLVGDAVLKEVSRRMANVLRPYDHLGRYGGEEFLIILNADLGQETVPFERIRKTIADKPFIVDQDSLEITISCGVVLTEPTSEENDVTRLVAIADKALYKAKENGRNRVIIAN